MKKIIIVVVVLGLLVAGYTWVERNARVKLGVLEGKKTLVKRGDLEVPISASGSIEPASITEIKGEASGEVLRIPFEVGQMVKKDDLIVELDQSDEKRSVERAKSQVETARRALKKAEIAKETNEKVTKPTADADLTQAEARAEMTREIFENRKELYNDDPGELVHPIELTEARTNHAVAKAQVKAANAAVAQATIAGKLAHQDFLTAEENLKTAGTTLEDAEERLAETKVLAPLDSMVLTRAVQVGEMVRSGTQSLMGGTVLVTLADVREIYAVVNVDEADIGMVRAIAPASARPGAAATQPVELPPGTIDLGQEVEIEVEAFLDKKFYGLIERVAPQSILSQGVATFKVWIRIVSDNRDLLVGLLNSQCQANFTIKSVQDALLVDVEAMVPNPDGEGYGVNVPVDPTKPTDASGKPAKKYEFRACKFGVDNQIVVEVIEGLQEGQEVYITPPLTLDRDKDKN